MNITFRPCTHPDCGCYVYECKLCTWCKHTGQSEVEHTCPNDPWNQALEYAATVLFEGKMARETRGVGPADLRALKRSKVGG